MELPEAVTAALAQLKDPSAKVRLKAARALEAALKAASDEGALTPLGCQDAIKPLCQILLETPKQDESIADRESRQALRSEVAQALGNIGSKDAVGPLIEALLICQDDENDVQSDAAFALAKIGDPAAIGPLIQVVLQDPCGIVVCDAVEVLGDLGGKEAIEPLSGVLRRWKDDDKQMITEIHGRGHDKYPVWDSRVACQWQAVDAMGRIGGKETLKPLIWVLQQAEAFDWYVVKKATQVLGDVIKGSRVLVFGGATDLGERFIKLAAAQGAEVYTTVSAKRRNAKYCKSLGATVLDHEKVDWIKELAGKDVDVILDCCGDDLDKQKWPEVLAKDGVVIHHWEVAPAAPAPALAPAQAQASPESLSPIPEAPLEASELTADAAASAEQERNNGKEPETKACRYCGVDFPWGGRKSKPQYDYYNHLRTCKKAADKAATAATSPAAKRARSSASASAP